MCYSGLPFPLWGLGPGFGGEMLKGLFLELDLFYMGNKWFCVPVRTQPISILSPWPQPFPFHHPSPTAFPFVIVDIKVLN